MKSIRSPFVKMPTKAPTGLLGAEPQSTAILDMFWRGGFLLVVIAYALLTSGGVAVLLRQIDITAQQLIAASDRALDPNT